MKKVIISIVSVLIIIGVIWAILPSEKSKVIEKPNVQGLTLKIYSSVDLAGGSYLEGAQKFAADYGCTVEFTDNFYECDLFYSSGEDFSQCMPLNDYIDTNSNLYTKSIMDQACTIDGKIFGLSHVLLGKINYCVYDPDQFGEAKTPHEYFNDKTWNWVSFINMAGEIDSNIAIDWNASYINMMHALYRDKNGNPTFNYGTQKQVEWLNFVRALIYDRGVVDNSAGAYEVGFLPQLILDHVDSETQLRFIPWPTKNGELANVFVDEYHFCVPTFAKNPQGSVELANYMLKSCIDTRTALYQANMTEEDFKLFEKQLQKAYCYPPHSDYVPASEFINDFIRGKTVSEHIYNVKNSAEHIN